MRSLWFWVGAAGMTAGTLPALFKFVTERGYRKFYAMLASITGIAAVTYVVMALGIGAIAVPRGELLVPRYVDWLLTTALIVTYLAVLSDPAAWVYLALLGTDIGFVGLGIAAAAVSAPMTWVLFTAGTLVYPLFLYLLLWYVPRNTEMPERRRAIFVKLRNLTVVLWTIYPVVWILSPIGLGVLNAATESLAVTYLDFITKAGFVIIAVNGGDALRSLPSALDREESAEAETEATPAD